MGKIRLESGHAGEAVDILHRAEAKARPQVGSVKRCHECQTIFNLLADAYQSVNRTDWAEHWYREALRERPDHIPAYLKYGKMLAKNVSF
jgi:Tfp pilus assembly protein PilF